MPRVIEASEQSAVAERFAHTSGLGKTGLAFVSQVHGNRVLNVRAAVDWIVVGEGDALMTRVPEMALIIRTADCVPLVFFDAARGVLAVAHAGYQGVLAGVIESTIKAMEVAYKCRAADMQVLFGPAICAQHYDVSRATDDRVARFKNLFAQTDGVVHTDGERVLLDLPGACRILCVRSGVNGANIGAAGPCTFEHPAWPSHRREGEERHENVWTWACLQK